ncbi:MAG: hypothetical protein UHD09_09245 [Bifidobacterium sp.]|nr:hypothetical protein [Bifidobacterium sp.]
MLTVTKQPTMRTRNDIPPVPERAPGRGGGRRACRFEYAECHEPPEYALTRQSGHGDIEECYCARHFALVLRQAIDRLTSSHAFTADAAECHRMLASDFKTWRRL